MCYNALLVKIQGGNQMINIIENFFRYLKTLITSHLIKVNGELIEVIPEDFKSINVEGEEITIGEEIVIYEEKWVHIVNTSITYRYKEKNEFGDETFDCVPFSSTTIRAGDFRRTVKHGEIEVLGFTDKVDGNMKVLVSHTSARYNYEVYCPDGTKFLLEPKEFISMREVHNKNDRPLNYWGE